MQLTKLEIKGFKSFADRVVINFDEGITGIVGPNGCGKSNVVDSIRWVLGEQKTRVLRSDKMENVIFNGTKARKQTQLAEVSLTFDNTKNLIPTEYASVTITRRYYRSGDSEYLLNGVTCRLKDITNLFLDTGIASNSYAIIELKMVDDILNDKDNSRRALFEEAAGISKFKIRKKETLKKLGDTDADLERVEDLLYEIEKNLKSLERQAAQAKKYYQLKEDYKQSSITLAKISLDQQQIEFDEISAKITSESDKKEGLSTLFREKEVMIVTSKTAFINQEQLLSSRQKTLNDHVSSIRQYESEKKIKNERSKFLNDKIESLSEQIDHDKESSERAALSLEGLKSEVVEAEKAVNSALELLEGLQEQYEQQKSLTQEAKAFFDELTQNFTQKKDQLFQIKKEIEIKTIQLNSLTNELQKTSEDSDEKNASLGEFEEKLSVLETEKNSIESIYTETKNKQESLENAILQTEELISAEREELAIINRSIDSKQNEFSLTKSLVDNLEGFPEAIKFLKKNTKWKDAPLLSDIISCPEDYRVAIENFLEVYMNYYIVEKEDDALAGIKLLNETSRGRANFFVLEKIQRKSIPNKPIQNAKSAINVTEFDSKYTDLIHHLLGDVFFAEDAAMKEENEVILIDKKGVLINGKQTISGGSVGLFEGKRIGRAKNLEKLETEIKSLKKQQGILNKSQETLKAKVAEQKSSQQKEKLEELRLQLNQTNERYVSLKTKKEQFAEILESNKNRRERIQQQAELLRAELEKIEPQSAIQEEQLEELENQVQNKRLEIEEIQRLLDRAATAYNEQNVAFHQKQNRLESLLQEISFKQETYENSVSRIQENQKELAEVRSTLNSLLKKSTENDDELLGMYEEKESLELGVHEAEKDYYDSRGKIEEEEKALKEIQRAKESLDNTLMDYKNQLNEAKLALNSVKDRLSVEFNIDLDEIQESQLENYKDLTIEELRSKVEKFRSKIDNMGPINPMAMEAYEEIKERHTFITTQKEDLLTAKETLLTTIGEIDEVAKETFMDAFEKIKDNFIKVFRTLFTEEDDCDLILTNPESPLESSIDIIAKPKGKRPLTINQLSGGEKTLTATSLLFSIYLLKPAPFCIFDEVDAPLDDANIDKFNEIIRKFSKESQFIIVTHNKRTMASTDIIYGVTMQEQGVSKVIPVDLRELA